MTEAEALELTTLFTANALTGFTIFISFTFAFLTAIHFVGDRIGKIQAASASIIYIIAAGSAAMTALTNWMVLMLCLKLHQTCSLIGLFGTLPFGSWVWRLFLS